MDELVEDSPRSARPPLRPRALGRWTWQLAKDVWREYGHDSIGDFAAAITFWTILSVPAAVLALVSMLSSLESVVGASVAEDFQARIEDYLTDTFADSETLVATVRELFESSNRGVATVAVLIALFTASRAFAALIRALDVAYEVDDPRPWWYLRLVALALGVGTIVVVAAGATILAVLPSLPLGPVARVLTPPIVFLALIMWSATVFHIGPHHRTPWRYDLPGAIVTTTMWVAASQGFALYVRVAGSGNDLQTGVGAILLALTLLYILSVALLIGAETNDVLARRAGVVQEPRTVTMQVTDQVRRLGDRILDEFEARRDEDGDDGGTTS